MHFDAAYNMQPPYVVLRRWPGPVIDMGDAEWFMGHRPRVWFAWKKAVPRWEAMHIATHDGLLRFPNEATVRAYVERHGDMSGQSIELVHVELSEHRRG